jgi:uncharacterized oxidoreductase
MKIDHVRLLALANRIVAAGGSSPAEASIVAEHLLEANLRGHDSHGVGMLVAYVRDLDAGTLKINQTPEIVSDTGTISVWDARSGYGQVVARQAVEWAIAAAKKHGVAVNGLRNAHHIGRVGTYGEMCAAAGLVSISFVNITDQRPAVAPWRGSDARFGTNPVTVAIPGPTPDRPIIADMATSRIAMGKVRVARNKGEEIADGTLLDADGRPTTDPNVMYRRPRGALLTFAEHKGYALAFICEILAGAVTGSGTMRPERQEDASVTNGMLLVVIDPMRLTEPGWLNEEIRAMTDYVTASPPRNASEPVLIPGDPERLMREKRIAEGVPIDEETWREFAAAARTVNVLVEA